MIWCNVVALIHAYLLMIYITIVLLNSTSYINFGSSMNNCLIILKQNSFNLN